MWRKRLATLPEPAIDQGLVDLGVAAAHRLGRELLGVLAALLGVDLADPFGRLAISSTSSQMKPVTPSTITSGTEPRRSAITGVPAASDSIITRPKGSGQSLGNRVARAPA